jgi:hypothetical protein
MKKVKITIIVTDKLFTREVEYKGKTYRESFKKTDYGADGLEPAIDDQIGLPDFIKENLDDAYDLMRALAQNEY